VRPQLLEGGRAENDTWSSHAKVLIAAEAESAVFFHSPGSGLEK
jgi:hypothetical protein